MQQKEISNTLDEISKNIIRCHIESICCWKKAITYSTIGIRWLFDSLQVSVACRGSLASYKVWYHCV